MSKGTKKGVATGVEQTGPASASRRQFFKIAGAAGVLAKTLSGAEDALASELPAPKANTKKFVGGKFARPPVVAKGRVLGASDRINLGHIGLGNMGGPKGHLKHLKHARKELNIQPVALCDVYTARLDKARDFLLDGDPEGMTLALDKDYRRLLDNKDVDAVFIATPEHWHCQIAAHALEAGKHVYVEKPMARYLDEGFQLYDTWKRTGRVVQVGAQYTSDPKYHVARDLVGAGKLGPLVSAQSSYTRNVKEGEWNYHIDDDAGPENLDWGMWLGSAPRRPWNEEAKQRFFRYRKYRDYSGGILGDLMPHRIHPLLQATGGNDWPLKVQCIGTRKISTDREVADTVTVMAEMQSGWTFLFTGSTVNEQGLVEMVRGNRASLYLAGKEPELRPERPYADEMEGGVQPVPETIGEPHPVHERNFIESIRANRQPNCNMELAIRTQTLISLAEISEVTGHTVLFDPARRSWKLG
jgi:predicted dehydrogenase